MSKEEGASVTDDLLAAFVDRIIRLKSEEDAIKADIKEIYQEAHGNGLNKTRLGEVVTHVRKHEKDATGEAEKEAIRDLYLAGYYRSKNKPHAHAYARGAANAPEHDADGVITDDEEINTNAPAAAALSAPTVLEEVINDPTTAEEQHNEVATTSAQIVTGEGAPIASVTPLYAASGIVVMEHTPPEPVRWHPYANCFPTVLGLELASLEKAIHARFGGVENPIIKIGNLILDGRARYGISRSLQIDYPVVQYDGNDALRDVIAWNLASRNLTTTERKAVAQKLAKLEPSRADEIMDLMGVAAEVAA